MLAGILSDENPPVVEHGEVVRPGEVVRIALVGRAAARVRPSHYGGLDSADAPT